MTNQFTKTQKKEIVRAYKGGESAVSIANRMMCGPSTIYRVLTEQGVPRRLSPGAHQGQRRFSDDIEQKIAVRYEAGEGLEVLAGEFGCSVWVIRQALKRNGVESRPKGNHERGLSEVDAQRALSLWDSGEPISVICQFLGGISRHRVTRSLHGAGRRTGSRHARGEGHGQWKGGRIEHNGYVLVRLQTDNPFYPMTQVSGYIAEHRLVMAQYLGRCLKDWETVHHIDLDYSHNEITNLQLRIGKHGKGAAYKCSDCGSDRLEPIPLAVTAT